MIFSVEVWREPLSIFNLLTGPWIILIRPDRSSIHHEELWKWHTTFAHTRKGAREKVIHECDMLEKKITKSSKYLDERLVFTHETATVNSNTNT